MGNLIHLLIIEDSESDAALVVRLLSKAGYGIDFERVETAEEMDAAFRRQSWDAIISEYDLPMFDGPSALRLLKETDLDVPFIIVSGAVGEETAVEMMRLGAHDYLMKGKLSRLVPAVEREIREARIRREHKAAELARMESEERYRAVTESAHDAIISSDSNGNIVGWNHGAEEMLGWDAHSILGQNVSQLFPDIYTELQNAGLLQVNEHVETQIIGKTKEFLAIRKDNRQIPIELSMAQWETSKGVFYSAIVRNIEDRKQAEAQIHRQLIRLHALRTIDTTINSSFNLQSTLDVILEQTITQLEVDAAIILKFNLPILTLEYAAGRGFRSPVVQKTQIKLDEGYTGRIFLEDGNINIPNIIAAGGKFAQSLLPAYEAFSTYQGAPLIVKGEIKGVLVILKRSKFHPDDEWLSFLDTLAGQAAIAINTLELFDGMQLSNKELVLAYDTTLEGWSHALDLRDKETEGHTQRVVEISLRLARKMGVPDVEMIHIRRGALLHDIGKLGIPDKILLKEGPLSPEEWVIMRRHPGYAYEWLKPITYLQRALDIPYCHHEKWDGSGYPRGLIGEEIPLPARIFALADVYDALTSDRPYRKAITRKEALDYQLDQSGKHFDPQVVEAFLALLKTRELG